MTDYIARSSTWLLVVALGAGPAAANANAHPGASAEPLGLSGSALDVAQDSQDKAEKERQKQEEKSAQKELRDQKESKDILDEIQPDLDALALEMMGKSYADRFLQDYVNEIGQSLVPKETPVGVLFSFRVVRDAAPNAFALADGRIYVTAGLLVFVQNEAQLAVVLGHEIGHVIQGHYIESVKQSRSFTRAVLPGLLGAALGAAVGGAVKGKEGAATGAAIGLGAGAIYSVATMNSYNRKQEDEADRMGVTLAMNAGYDPKQGATFFQKLADTYGAQDRFKTLLWANHSRNVDRVKTVDALLDTQLASAYNSAKSGGKLTAGTGQLSLYSSRMIRDVAVWAMDDYDRFALAKTLLDSIVDYRARDPKTLWAIGRVYKTIGRTESDKGKALDYLQRAVSIDERNMYPYILRDLGLMQARLGVGQMPAAIESLKAYVRGYMDKYAAYPADIEEMYDYLLIFGDGKWTAPKMDPTIIRASNPTPAPEPSAPVEPIARPQPNAPVRSVQPARSPRKIVGQQ